MYALVIATDTDERAILSLVLQRVGMATTARHDLDRAIEQWPQRPADMVVLAVPGCDDHTVASFRAVSQVPIVAVMDGPDEDRHIAMLEAGADMVLSRPYSSRLLVTQLRALLRRAGGVPIFSLPTLSIGGLTLDPASRMVTVDGGQAKRLTQLEFRLLYALMVHRGQILPTDVILEQVWGYTDEGNPDLVRGLVSRLRSKVEADPQEPKYVMTIPGSGYGFQPTGPE